MKNLFLGVIIGSFVGGSVAAAHAETRMFHSGDRKVDPPICEVTVVTSFQRGCPPSVREFVHPLDLSGVPSSKGKYMCSAVGGTQIGFANGKWLTSYFFEPGIAGTKIGDRAQVCLISVPLGCPPGDTRGKIYQVMNLRTGKTLTMPDSEHECGGA